MTKAEITAEALSLEPEERVALAETLLSSVSAPSGRFSAAAERALCLLADDALRSGPAIELSDSDWERLGTSSQGFPRSRDALGTPPGWSSSRG